MDARESVAVVVAHPDDETLWAGGLLLSSKAWSTFVCTACRASDVDRAPKFYQALARLGAEGTMADLDDGPEQRPLADEAVDRALLECLPSRAFARVLTHSPLGEYTRHVRHEEVARAVLRLWLRARISASEIWLFAYEDDSGSKLPTATVGTDISLELSAEIWQQKYQLLTDCYGFSATSWEARATPRREAFYRITTFEQAVLKLQQKRMP